MVTLERQNIYGWPVILDLFFAGAGASLYLLGYVLHLLKTTTSLIYFFSGLGLVAVGTFFLLWDITIRRRIVFLLANPRSWTTIGTWAISFFLLCGIIYLATFSFPLLPKGLRNLTGIISTVTSLLIMLYPGFLISSIKAVPLWYTPLTPLLFFSVNLTSGLATTLLVALYVAEPLSLISGLERATMICLCFQLILLFLFLLPGTRNDAATKESLRQLRASHFFLKIALLGGFLPLFLFLKGNNSFAILGIIFVLTGGLYLRYGIINAGVYLPRFEL